MKLTLLPGGRLAAAMAAAALAGCVVVPAHRPRIERPALPPPPLHSGAPPMYFYPELRQSEAQQDRDRYECYRWAVRETGHDPGMTPLREVPRGYMTVPPPSGGEVAGGAVAGAVAGSVLSSPRHMGQGAVIGAIFGAMIGAASYEAQARAHEQSQAREASRADATRRPTNNFRRAMTACMEGRGYRVQ